MPAVSKYSYRDDVQTSLVDGFHEDRYFFDEPTAAETDDGEWSLVGRYQIAGALAVLTDQEREIFVRYRGPYSAATNAGRKELAQSLGMAQMTFDTHVRNLNRKLKTYISTLDSIAASCDPLARNAISTIRQEVNRDWDELMRQKHALRQRFSSLKEEVDQEQEELEKRRRFALQQTFDLACSSGLLDELEQRVYDLTVIKEKPYKDVAELLGLPIEDVKRTLARVRARLKTLSSKYELRLVPKSEEEAELPTPAL